MGGGVQAGSRDCDVSVHGWVEGGAGCCMHGGAARLLKEGKVLPQAVCGGGLQVEDAHLVLVLQEELPVCDGVGKADVLEVVHALQGHQDPLEPVRDLHRRDLQGLGA